MGRKGKERTAKQKAADKRASQRMKGTNPFKRGRSRSSASSAPRRRRKAMAKGKKSGGGRRKRFAVTPKNVGKLVLVIDGARRVISADYSTASWYLHNKPTALLGSAWKDKAFTSKLVQPAVGLAEIIIVPKIADKGVALLNKGTPLVNRVANMKLATI